MIANFKKINRTNFVVPLSCELSSVALRKIIQNLKPDKKSIIFLVEPFELPTHEERFGPPVTDFIIHSDLLLELIKKHSLRKSKLAYDLVYLVMNYSEIAPVKIYVREFPFQLRGNKSKIKEKISIIIPHRGDLNYLNRCLSNLFNTGADKDVYIYFDEIINNNHKSLMKNFSSCQYYRANKKNIGPYVFRDFISSISRNSLIAYQDSDDISTADRFFHLSHFLKKNASIGFVGSHELRVDEIKEKLIPVKYPLHVSSSLKEKPNHALLYPTSMIRKSAYLASNGISTIRRYASDTQFLLNTYFYSEIRNVDAFLYLRRIHKDSLTQSKRTALGNSTRTTLLKKWYRDFKSVNAKRVELKKSSLHPEKRKDIQFQKQVVKSRAV